MPGLQFYLHGEGGHKAWIMGWDRKGLPDESSRSADVFEDYNKDVLQRTQGIRGVRNGWGWLISDMLAYDLRWAVQHGFRISVRPGHLQDEEICDCRSCRFLVDWYYGKWQADKVKWRDLEPPR